MSDDRLCIICDARKPVAQFETKGEHIVPRSLGNRRLRTPYVCRACNGGLGGTVDVALRNVFRVALACVDRGVGGARESGLPERGSGPEPVLFAGDDSVSPRARKTALSAYGPSPLANPDVKGAILKIVYEAAHLCLGNNWLHYTTAAAIRDVLFAYVNKDRGKARELMSGIAVRDIPIDLFYFKMGKSRSEHIKRAIISKTCLNSLWLTPVKTPSGDDLLAVVFDIEGLPPGYVVVSNSDWDIEVPELLAPNIK